MSEWRQMEGQKVAPKAMVQTQAVLAKLKQAVEELIKQKRAEKTAAQEQLHRMKHGGGS